MFSDLVHDPNKIIIICLVYIVSYYAVSFLSFRAANNPRAFFRQNGPLDVFTSIFWVGVAILLIWSLATLAFSKVLTLSYLIIYYFIFVFLFAFCYGILDWHFRGMLDGVDRYTWRGLLEHLIMSTQTQTTIGYTKWKPGKLIVEVVACIQALLGIFFLTLAVGRAVSKLP